MPSLFAELETLASAAVDTVMGELTRIEPQSKGGVFAGSADGSRPVLDNIIGIPDFNPVTVTAQDEGTYDGFQPQLAGDRIHVSYAESSFPNAASWPQAGDYIVLKERSGIAKLKVHRGPERDGIGRFICICVPA